MHPEYYRIALMNGNGEVLSWYRRSKSRDVSNIVYNSKNASIFESADKAHAHIYDVPSGYTPSIETSTDTEIWLPAHRVSSFFSVLVDLKRI